METDATAPLPKGYRLGPYTVESVVAQDRAGITYLASEASGEGWCYIRENLPAAFAGRAGGGDFRIGPLGGGAKKARKFAWSCDMLCWEAATLHKLETPGVNKPIRAFKALGTVYHISPHVPGCTLEEWVGSRDLPGRHALGRLLLSLLSILKNLHGQGVQHLAVSPGNIIIRNNGDPVLTGINIAGHLICQYSGAPAATGPYAAPEQFSAQGRIGPWTDVYALGATFHRILMGEAPPGAAAGGEAEEVPAALARNTALVSMYGEPLLAGIDKAMAPGPENRWTSAAEWYEAVLRITEPQGDGDASTGSATTTEGPVAVPPPPRRHLWHIAACVGVLASVSAAIWLWMTREGRFWSALQADDTPIVCLMLERGLDPDTPGEGGTTPLMWAASRGDVQMTRLLVNAGADVTARNAEGATPARIAFAQGHADVCLYLTRTGAQLQDAASLTDLAWCYANGYAIAKDPEQAAMYYRQAADMGYAEAQYNLGLCYENGSFGERNTEEALKWYRMAAAQGHKQSMDAVGRLEPHPSHSSQL